MKRKLGQGFLLFFFFPLVFLPVLAMGEPLHQLLWPPLERHSPAGSCWPH